MKLTKMVTDLFKKHSILVFALAAAAIIYLVDSYSRTKGLEGAKNVAAPQHVSSHPPEAPGVNNKAGSADCCGDSSNYQPSNPLGHNETNAPVSGIQTNQHGLPASCTSKQVVDPSQLLPKDGNNKFSQMNPMGAGDVKDVSFIKAGYHIGINTVGQSLRNANLQLRSEPANPQLNVGPWNTSTIGPDFNRRPLEIGCGPM